MKSVVSCLLMIFCLSTIVVYGHKTFTVFNKTEKPIYYQVSVKGCHMWNLPGGATPVDGSGKRVYMFRASLDGGKDSGAVDLTEPTSGGPIAECGVWVRVCVPSKTVSSQNDCTTATESCYMHSWLWGSGNWTNDKNVTGEDAPFKCTTGHPYHFEVKKK